MLLKHKINCSLPLRLSIFPGFHYKIRTISFIVLDKKGLIPNWHGYFDTLENIEGSTIQGERSMIVSEVSL